MPSESVYNIGDPGLRPKVIVQTNGSVLFQLGNGSCLFDLTGMSSGRTVTFPDTDLDLSSIATSGDISAALAAFTGSAAITALGTIASGTVPVARVSGLGTLATQNGTFSGTSSGTNTGDQTTVSGNAGSATILQNARNINGVSFNGSANITITCDAGTLTGTTLNATVVTSSLTAVGTIATGVWNATAIADGKIASALTGKTYNGLTLTTTTGTFTLTNGKTLSVSNTMTLTATDGSTVACGAGGTVSYIGATETISGAKTFSGGATVQTTLWKFKTNMFTLENPAATFSALIQAGAQTANRTFTFPVVNGAKTIAMINFDQTFTGTQTFSNVVVSGSLSLSNSAAFPGLDLTPVAGNIGLNVTAAVGTTTDIVNFCDSSTVPRSGVTKNGEIWVTIDSGAPSTTPLDGCIHVDTTNHRIYFRSGGAWKYAQGI